MFDLPKSLLRNTAAVLLTGTGLAGAGTTAPPSLELASAQKGWWNQPIAVALEARTVERSAAFGMHLVRPVYHRADSTLNVEAYGFEGEGELAIVGGGVVYRRSLGRRSSVEANGFFEGLRSTDGFAYPQAGAGLAFSPDRWITLRANGYLPLEGKERRRNGTERWSDRDGAGADWREVDWSRARFSERAPMRGFDVEAELRLPHPPRWVDPRLAVGYAYREAEGRPEVYAGVTVRGELHFGEHWVVEGEWRDDMSGVEQAWRVGVRFQMLLGAGGMEKAGASQVPSRESASAGAQSDPRAAERFLPAKRFPWPTVARGEALGDRRRGEVRTAVASQTAPEVPAPEDCCNSGQSPLIYD